MPITGTMLVAGQPKILKIMVITKTPVRRPLPCSHARPSRMLVMNEPEPLDDSDERLLALQDRFNAYVSFLLDGEMAETNPDLADRPARIELRCAHIPDPRALELLGMIHDQLAFQEIKMEVVVAEARG